MNPADQPAARGSDWAELQGRLYRFFRVQPDWSCWREGDPAEIWCGPDGWQGREPASANRIQAVQDDPALIPSRAKPEFHEFREATARGWHRLQRGVFTYLGGPARLDDLVRINAVFFSMHGSADVAERGADAPSESGSHLTLEQMDDWVEARLDAAQRDAVQQHTEACRFCRHQLSAYQQAAPEMSAAVRKAPVAHPTEAEPAHHAAPPAETAKQSRLRAFFSSPPQILALLGGLAVVFGGPYLLWRTVAPGDGVEPLIETVLDTGAQDVPLDLSVVDTLPPMFYDGAVTILGATEPAFPEILFDLPDPVGFAIIYPLTEAVDTDRPAFRWQPVGPPPYSVTVRDARNRVVAQAPAVVNPTWVIPTPLQRNAVYTWVVTAPDDTYEQASFLVLGEEEVTLWRGMQAQYADSPLARGLVAQQLGLLTAAEQAFRELLEQNPNSGQAQMLLENVVFLREPVGVREDFGAE